MGDYRLWMNGVLMHEDNGQVAIFHTLDDATAEAEKLAAVGVGYR